MPTVDFIRNLIIKATTQGVDEAASKTEKLAGSMDKVAVSSEKMSKSSLNVEQSLLRTLKTIDPTVRAQENMRKTQESLDAARMKGLISQNEQNRLMQQALVHFNKGATAAKEHSQALQELNGAAQSLSGNLGALGGVLARIGPAGLAIAAALGGVALAFTVAAKGALELADTAGKLVDLSDTVGLTVVQLQGLEAAAAQVGIAWEPLTTGLERFAASMGKLNESDKATVQSLERLGEGTAQSVASLTTMSDRLDAVFRALTKVDAASAALSAKDLFGKAGIQFVRLAQSTVAAGGSIDDLVSKLNNLDVITRAQAERWDAFGDTIRLNLTIAKRNIDSVFADATLEPMKEMSEALLRISRVAKEVGGPLATAFSEQLTAQIIKAEEAITKFLKSLEGLTAEQQFQAILDQLIDPRLVQFFRDLATVVQEFVDALIKAIAAMQAFANRDFNLASIAQAFNDLKNSFNGFNAAIGQAGATLSGEVNAPLKITVGTLNQGSAAVADFGDEINKLFPSGKTLSTMFTINPEARQSIRGVKLDMEDTAKTVKEKVNPALQELGQVAGQIGASLVTAFLKGENAAKALKTTLQSVASSATSSSINKLVTGDFAGAAVSGGIAIGASLLSFLFGDDEQDKRNREEVARQQAEAAALVKRVTEAWAALADELAAFERQAQGLTEGTLRKAIDSINETTQSFIDTAAAAGTAAGTAQAAAAGLANVNRVLTEFFQHIDAAVDEFGKSTTPVLTARSAVKSLMDDFKSLTDDIIFFGEQTGDAAGTMERLARLQAQGAQAFLALIDASEPISDVVKNVQSLKAGAVEVTKALIELGVAAEDAAAMVDTKLNASLAKLAGDFLAPLIESINDFVGGGWINDAEALIAQVKQLRTDAIALGVDTRIIDTFYVIEAQKIIDSNELVGQSFSNLAHWLGISESELHEFTAAVEGAGEVIKRTAKEIADAVLANEDRLALALHRSDSLADQLFRFDLAAQREREKEIAAGGEAIVSLEAALAQERLNVINDFLDEQRRAAEQAAEDIKRQNEQIAEENKRLLDDATEFIQSQVRRISDWIANFLAGPTSTLPPSQQLATAQQHFASEMSLAASGNRDALSNITSAAQTLVDATRRYYGSSAAGQSIISNLITQLRGLPSQLTPEEFIVGELKPPIEDIPGSIGDQTTALSALLNNLKLAIQSGDAQAIAVALLPLFDNLDTTMDQALSFAEFQAGLGANYTTGTLRSIFNELDNNGNGLIEKTELIKLATGATEVATEGTNTKLATTNDLLTAIRNLNQTIAATYDVQINMLSGIAAINTNTAAYLPYLATIASWAPGSSHELGGLLTGPRHSAGGIPIAPGHYAEGGEYIMSRRTVSAYGVATMDAMNYGSGAANDNIFSAIRGLERSLLRGIKALMETQMEAAGVMAAPMKEANKLSRARRGAKAA